MFFGSKCSVFPFHYEDMDLFSININLEGKAKIWNIVRRKYHEIVDTISFSNQTVIENKCPLPKYCLINPSIFDKFGVKHYIIIQKEGMAVVTFSKVGHQGINVGYNVAEAVNFCLDS